MSDFDWPDVSYFQAKFGWERVKASKVILNYSQLSRFDKPFGGTCKVWLEISYVDFFSSVCHNSISKKRLTIEVSAFQALLVS